MAGVAVDEPGAAALPLALAPGVHGPQDVMTVVERTKVWVTLPETVYENTEPSDCVTIDWQRTTDKKARRLNNAEKNFIVGTGGPDGDRCTTGRFNK